MRLNVGDGDGEDTRLKVETPDGEDVRPEVEDGSWRWRRCMAQSRNGPDWML